MTATHQFTALVGIDGSTNSRSALDWAINYVAARGGLVKVVMSWSYAPVAAAGYGIGGALPPADSMSDATEASLASALEGLHVPDNVAVEGVVAEGAAARVLLHEAETSEADIIVVGKRGHGGFVGLLIGSVATQVANHAPCPVVIVPSDDDHK